MLRVRAGLGVALAVAFLRLPGAAADPAPELRMSATSGPPTTPVRISGRGFAPHEEVVVRFDDLRVGEEQTDDTGRFGARFHVPARALPGPHRVRVVGSKSGLRVGARFTVRTDWAMFRFSPEHTGHNPYEHVLSPETVGDLEVAWAAEADSAITGSSPAVVGGVVYVGASSVRGDARLYAFRAHDGELLWKTEPFRYSIDSSPAVAFGKVFIMAYHTVLAFEAATGELVWQKPVGAGFQSSPTVANGLVYVGGDRLYALDPETGRTCGRTGPGGT